MTKLRTLALLNIGVMAGTASAFVVPLKTATTSRGAAFAVPRKKEQSIRSSSTLVLHESNDDSPLDAPWKLDIPDEYKNEILAAEGNTPAAKERNTRVAFYILAATLGIGIASFNAFLTQVRGTVDGDGYALLESSGFGWVLSNGLFSFLFLNGIGGAIALLTAGLSGTMVELEQRARNDNAEKIWKEIQRRKGDGATGSTAKKNKVKSEKKKKKQLKNRKRLAALSEVIVEENEVETVASGTDTATTSVDEKDVLSPGQDDVQPGKEAEELIENSSADAKEGGVLGKIKNLYEQADRMAASQALLLNKELEDRGVIDKITDETGLRVVGKEEAEKIAKSKSTDSKDS